MEGVVAAAGDDTDDAAGSLTIFGPVAVEQHLELGDGLVRRIDQDGAIRAYVVVVDAIDEEQVIGGGIAVDRHVHATVQALAGVDEVVRGGDAGLKLRQLDEVAAVERKFLDLGSVDDAPSAALSVCTCMALASTVMDSLTLPSCNCALTVVVVAT